MARGDLMGSSAARYENLLTITVEQQDGVSRLRLAGELDLSGVRDLKRALRAAETDGTRVIHLDMTKVAFMDCSGLTVLLTARNRAREAGVELVVRGATGEVWRLLQLTGVDPLFEGAHRRAFPDGSGHLRIQPKVEPERLDG
jgi:anti-sigma B factor antagonist